MAALLTTLAQLLWGGVVVGAAVLGLAAIRQARADRHVPRDVPRIPRQRS